VSTSGSKVLRGSIPPIITPFRNGKVDYEAYAGLLEFQLKEGTHGILVNGTSSEPSTLTTEERNRLVDVAMEAAGGRLKADWDRGHMPGNPGECATCPAPI